MKIGLLGGSFNPIHIGHLILAESAKGQLSLEKILFIPSHLPPHKTAQGVVSAKHRYEMVRLAVKDKASFGVSDIEVQRRGTSYTIETVKTLRKKMPSATFTFLIGSDCLKGLSTWKEIEALFRLCRFVIAKRPRFPLTGVPNGFQKINIPQIDVSSRVIRERIAEGKSIAYQVPRTVALYIQKHHLYR